MNRNDKVISLKARKHAKKFKWLNKIVDKFLALFRIKSGSKTKNSSYKKKIIG